MAERNSFTESKVKYFAVSLTQKVMKIFEESRYRSMNIPKKRFAAVAVCLCVIISVFVFMAVHEDNGTPYLEEELELKASDYFKYNSDNEVTNTSTIIAENEIPYSINRSFSDERTAMEESGIIPLMSDYHTFSCGAQYDENKNIISVIFSWYRRGDNYSTLRIVAGCQEIQSVNDCLSIEIDDDGNIVTPAVTVVERDGVTIVTTGGEREEKTITFQADNIWYQITGSWNDSYEDVVALLDWIWEHPVDFNYFDVDRGAIFTFSSLDECPTAFAGELPDFDGLGYILGANYVKLKNGVPCIFEGNYYKGLDAEIIEKDEIPAEGDWVEIQWYITSEPDYDELQSCSGNLTELSEQQVNSIISENGKLSFLFDSYLIKIYSESSKDVWELLNSLDK